MAKILNGSIYRHDFEDLKKKLVFMRAGLYGRGPEGIERPPEALEYLVQNYAIWASPSTKFQFEEKDNRL